MTSFASFAGDAPRAAFLRPPLDERAFYGLPGDVVRALAPHTEADPAALLLTFLAMLGNAAGREPHAGLGGGQHPGRLFVVLVGDPGDARKGTAHAVIERIFAEADPDWCENRVTGGVQSGEALIDLVADGMWDPFGARRSPDPRLLLAEFEFARLLERMWSGTLSATLCKAWDGSPLTAVRRKHTVRASRPHVSLIGHITPAQLLRHSARLHSAGGFESRTLFAYVARPQRISPFEPASGAAAAAGLAVRVRDVLAFSRESVLSGTDPISRELCISRGLLPARVLPVHKRIRDRWQAIESGLPRPHDEVFGNLTSRAVVHIIRLAVVYAIADRAPGICPVHVDAAKSLWKYCAQSVDTIFGVPYSAVPPEVRPDHTARLFTALHRAYPGWLSATDISAVFGRHLTGDGQVAAVINSLGDRLERRQVATGGRPRMEWRLHRPSPFTVSAPEEEPPAAGQVDQREES